MNITKVSYIVEVWIGTSNYVSTHFPHLEKLKTKYTSFSKEYNAYERLTSHSDIIVLEINYEDDSSEYIYVPFDGDCENKLQETNHEEVQGKESLEIYFKQN